MGEKVGWKIRMKASRISEESSKRKGIKERERASQTVRAIKVGLLIFCETLLKTGPLCSKAMAGEMCN